MAAAGFIPVVGWAGRAFKGGKAIYKTGKAAIAAEHALDAYKTGKSLDILKMSEMGAYGLVASNGFSEAVTGRDMFGNKVSEEKRKSGALEAALSLVGAGALAKHIDKGIPLAKSPQAAKVEKGKQILDQVKDFKVPTNVKIRVHKTVTPDGATFPIVHADVKTKAVKDLGIVKMVGSGNTNIVDKINYDLIKRYVKDVETRTSRKIPKNQVEKLKEALRNKEYKKLTPLQTRKHRRAFNKIKDQLIEEWEKNTGQTWPTYSEDVISKKTGEPVRKKGDKYDAHHIIENSFEGEYEWWNIHPAKFPNEHQSGIHGTGSPANELFKGGK